MLNVIDISSWQSDLDVARMSDTDGVIVKATGGASYKNTCMKEHMGQAARAGKLVGLYHFARDRGHEGSAQAEADYFVAAAKPYVGKATLWLDWEDGAIVLGPKWAKAWLDRVKAKTGVTPGIYMSKGVCNQYDWSAVAKTYPLWVAQYPNYERTGWQREPWTDSAPFGAWGKPVLFQYASTGRVKGYGGDLDLDLWYRDRAAWLSMCAVGGKLAAAVKAVVSGASSAAKAETIERGSVAAAIHKKMVQDERFGYSWEERWGAKAEKWTVDGVSFDMPVGDYDCSSSSIQAWRKALTGTKYAHALDAATYTGNMREVFVGSGLFSWKPMSFIASPGDLYLNEASHVAICQQQVPDELSEFSWGDNGAYGNRRGDQSGFESRVNPYYDYPWDGILHYNGKADTVIDQKPAGTTGTLYRIVKAVKVRKSRKVVSDNVVGQLTKGKTVRLVAVKKNANGTTWGRISEGTFKGRVICVNYKGASLRAVKVGPKTVDQLAHKVIAGDWGNGQARIDALTKKGYDAAAVQKRVNEILEG